MSAAAAWFLSEMPEPQDDGLESWEREIVDDPEALLRAERAVRAEPLGVAGPPDADSAWIPVASGSPRIAGVGGINDVALLLEGADVPVGWDPYDPRDAGSHFLGLGRAFNVLVRDTDLQRARAALDGLAGEGIDWKWPQTESATASVAPVGADEEWFPVPAGQLSSARSAFLGPATSDNRLLERSAGRAPSGVGIALLVLALAGVAAAVVLALLRG